MIYNLKIRGEVRSANISQDLGSMWMVVWMAAAGSTGCAHWESEHREWRGALRVVSLEHAGIRARKRGESEKEMEKAWPAGEKLTHAVCKQPLEANLSRKE